MLCEPKVTDISRMAAFTKRCTTIGLSAPTGEAMTLMGCVLRMMRKYPRLLNMLSYEGDAPVGGRSYNADCRDPSEAGALASTLWELAHLAKHYHPHVAKVSAHWTAGMGGGKCNSGSIVQCYYCM